MKSSRKIVIEKKLVTLPDTEFVNPVGDFAFKSFFATRKNKILSVSFLNALLEGEKIINDITLVPVERSGLTKDIKKVIYDAEGETSNNELFIMEMQDARQNFIISRNIYYAAANLHEQLSPGDRQFKLKDLTCVCLTNFIFDHENPDMVVKTIKFNVQENKEIFYNNLTFKYIELPKFRKTEQELVTALDKWLFALTNMQKLKEIPVSLRGDPIFEKLFNVARLSNLNKKQMNAYQRAEMDRQDYYRGFNVSRQEGMMEGDKNRQLNIVRKMVNNGEKDAVIMKYTEVSLEDLNRIRQEG